MGGYVSMQVHITFRDTTFTNSPACVSMGIPTVDSCCFPKVSRSYLLAAPLNAQLEAMTCLWQQSQILSEMFPPSTDETSACDLPPKNNRIPAQAVAFFNWNDMKSERHPIKFC